MRKALLAMAVCGFVISSTPALGQGCDGQPDGRVIRVNAGIGATGWELEVWMCPAPQPEHGWKSETHHFNDFDAFVKAARAFLDRM